VTSVSSPREPRQKRSRATRQSLLDATIQSLADVGWSGTTVVAVAARAGVSRGAAQHHFATRDDLVRAAVEQVTDELTRELRMQQRVLAGSEDRVLGALEVLADVWSGTVGRAATHLWVAASTDPTLRELVLPLERRLNREMFSVAADLIGADTSEPGARQSVGVSLQLLRGMGLSGLLGRDSAARRTELAQFAAMLSTVMRTEPVTTPSA
jgi:AcrR family transcriptional regulator